jgi:hypothetical protein
MAKYSRKMLKFFNRKDCDSLGKQAARERIRVHGNLVKLRRRAIALRKKLLKKFKSVMPPKPNLRGVYCNCASKTTRAAIYCAIWSMKARATDKALMRHRNKVMWHLRPDKMLIKLRLRLVHELAYAQAWAWRGNI